MIPSLLLGLRRHVVTAACATLVLMAGLVPASAQTQPGRSSSTGEGSAAAAAAGMPLAAVVLRGGTLITMDPRIPSATAIAVAGGRILAIGPDERMAAHIGPDTRVIELQGLTVTPGFIDSHQHRVLGRGRIGIEDAETTIRLAIEQGWTTLHEALADQALIDELTRLDDAGVLAPRVNAWLQYNDNDPEGGPLGPWYRAYRPDQMIRPHVRVAGLKIFTDFDNASHLLWEGREKALERLLVSSHRKGWQLAIKTVSTRSLEMIMQAYERAARSSPGIESSRGRLEHVLFATPSQIARMPGLGLIPSIQTNSPGQLMGEADIEALITREPPGSYAPWRSYLEAGLVVANGSAWPSFYVDEPTGAPFGSPMHITYQAVTRVGNLGREPYPWLLGQTITAEQSLRGLTIDAAYAAFQEDRLGSLTPGKLADLVVLSAHPLEVSTPEINEIDVLLTMVGGEVAYCAPEAGWLCPPGG